MTDKDQTGAFENDLNNLVERYRSEFEISYAQVIGTLEIKAWLLIQESAEESENATF